MLYSDRSRSPSLEIIQDSSADPPPTDNPVPMKQKIVVEKIKKQRLTKKRKTPTKPKSKKTKKSKKQK